MNFQFFIKPKNKLVTGLVVAGAAISVGTTFYGISQFGSLAKNAEPLPVETPPPRKITALGRLEPLGEVIRLGVSQALDGDRVSKLLVKEGDRVKAGQSIAILDAGDRLKSALEEAQEKVKVAEANLAKVKAGAKSGELAAQSATIGKLEAQLQGNQAAQQATVDRIQAQWQGEKTAQQATISRITAQWQGERKAQTATISRITAQWQGEKTAQTAAINKLKAESTNAETEYLRHKELVTEGAISNSVMDSKRLALETSRQELKEAEANLGRINNTAKQQLEEGEANLGRINSTGIQQLNEAEANLARINSTAIQQLAEAEATLKRIKNSGSEELKEAQATLDKIGEVRPVDLQAAQTEINSALAQVKRAQTELNQAYIRTPNAGKILKIHTRAGEKISDDGIADVGETQQMVVVAEVYQTDISKIKVGQKATVTSQAFSGELPGTVKEIGLKVSKQNVFSNQPGENLDSRVVEVKIHLNPEASKQVAGLTNLQVQVAIQKD
ncbi:MAG: biotin/lipoyl-binding protein [Microcoleus sp. PH2017_10_PVI_O_A]|uniref:efflux RND transporter periplasmic adaptor subunit n=1 Tax=unclassified Microcoleus TaxID=2642155 RepID=UPI001D563501|nr:MULTISPECIES: efflux RND transporter periplasmic adaptor subunit [unclassified Microcoleus]TAE85737.1 MAG: biotin/lipoyl-binding protein [Oscillatoriales cyanobacterium]MCC3404259.1 biotin/lipoyl-binding protein [Microcoleus sp. PH2017_10_PVI_O_A]MCC3458345.1 biotin/lipoyl-binding protein [Microcoleus sp. PH2017_11_PCY_U_A]MCC3478416.1 biotin/lipoyl-binding protein [Microcoleus sp. PH2017_12_PCY_D_A]MCC3529031.1 biotin/lipoyl-binding protein [Microcoleus sp. PH2017_21_RUC_O_A]